MSAISFNTNQESKSFQNFWKTGWIDNRPLRWTVYFSAALLLANVLGLIVDQRMLIGEPVWLKPTKFAISSVFYAASLGWVLSYIKDRPRLVGIVSWVTAIAMIVELVLISFQAYRGVRSHFNVSTPLDTAIFSTMGTAIALLWIASIVAFFALARQSFANRPWGAVVKWALFLTVIGSGLGGTMTSPNSDQLETANLTGELPESGAHTVGAPDGGEGLPGVGWSTEGGDLRIGHFLGLHALQILPVIGLLVLALMNGRPDRQKLWLIHIASIGYLGTVALITWQAFRGEPLIYPSTLTLAVVGGFYLVIGLLIALILFRSTGPKLEARSL